MRFRLRRRVGYERLLPQSAAPWSPWMPTGAPHPPAIGGYRVGDMHRQEYLARESVEDAVADGCLAHCMSWSGANRHDCLTMLDRTLVQAVDSPSAKAGGFFLHRPRRTRTVDSVAKYVAPKRGARLTGRDLAIRRVPAGFNPIPIAGVDNPRGFARLPQRRETPTAQSAMLQPSGVRSGGVRAPVEEPCVSAPAGPWDTLSAPAILILARWDSAFLPS
jgi:hypothetical protein